MTPANIIITGASSGIGAALTRALAGDGHRLFVCARRQDRLDEVTDHGRLACRTVCDVGEPAQVEAFMAGIRRQTDTIDALIHCAGVYGPIGPTHEIDPAAWLAAVQANVFGFLLMVRQVVPLMRRDRSPRVLVLSGGGAFSPLPNYSSYAVSKAAVVRLMETLAQELAPLGIMVNALAPGFVATEIHEATLAAGPERAGEDFFDMTRRKLADGATPIETPVACARWLLSDAAQGLAGKTISAGFDPWDQPEFAAAAADAADLYTMQRINLRHLDPGPVREVLEAASARKR